MVLSRHYSNGRCEMSDGRSGVVNLDLKEAEKIYTRLSRLLNRMKVRIDDTKKEGKRKMKVQYWNSGEMAEKKLEAFVRGFEYDG